MSCIFVLNTTHTFPRQYQRCLQSFDIRLDLKQHIGTDVRKHSDQLRHSLAVTRGRCLHRHLAPSQLGHRDVVKCVAMEMVKWAEQVGKDCVVHL